MSDSLISDNASTHEKLSPEDVTPKEPPKEVCTHMANKEFGGEAMNDVKFVNCVKDIMTRSGTVYCTITTSQIERKINKKIKNTTIKICAEYRYSISDSKLSIEYGRDENNKFDYCKLIVTRIGSDEKHCSAFAELNLLCDCLKLH